MAMKYEVISSSLPSFWTDYDCVSKALHPLSRCNIFGLIHKRFYKYLNILFEHTETHFPSETHKSEKARMVLNT